jgi:hypothetical protein
MILSLKLDVGLAQQSFMGNHFCQFAPCIQSYSRHFRLAHFSTYVQTCNMKRQTKLENNNPKLNSQPAQEAATNHDE